MTIAQTSQQVREYTISPKSILHKPTDIDAVDQPDYEKIEAKLNQFFDNVDAKHQQPKPQRPAYRS